MARIRAALTYSNVVATIAAFVALGGTSYAVTTLPDKSVGSRQLRDNAVVSSKIANRAVKSVDLATGVVPAAASGSWEGDPNGSNDKMEVDGYLTLRSTGRIFSSGLTRLIRIDDPQAPGKVFMICQSKLWKGHHVPSDGTNFIDHIAGSYDYWVGPNAPGSAEPSGDVQVMLVGGSLRVLPPGSYTVSFQCDAFHGDSDKGKVRIDFTRLTAWEVPGA